MRDWADICDTMTSEIDQDKRFNELSDETKELVRDLYQLEQQYIDEDVLTDIGVEGAKDVMRAFEMLFGEKNLK